MTNAERTLPVLVFEYLQRPGAPGHAAFEEFLSQKQASVMSRTKSGDQPFCDSADQFLDLTALIEVCCQLGPDEPIASLPLMQSIRRTLISDGCRWYYEEYRPQLLPVLLRERLAGRPIGRSPRAQSMNGPLLFMDLVCLQRTVQSAHVEIEAFLDVPLESSGERFVTLCAKPAEFQRQVVDPGNGSLTAQILGLGAFFRFASALDEFLRTIPDTAIQSSCWHLHHRWCAGSRASKAAVLALKSLELIGRWTGPSQGAEASANELADAITRLYSGRYQWPLIEAVLRTPDHPATRLSVEASSRWQSRFERHPASAAHEPSGLTQLHVMKKPASFWHSRKHLVIHDKARLSGGRTRIRPWNRNVEPRPSSKRGR